jgi:hypothetical protein
MLKASVPVGTHVGDGALDVISVDAAVLAVAFLAFEVDLTVEHPELLAHDFILSAVGMTWITSHKSGSSMAMTSSTTPRSSGPPM